MRPDRFLTGSGVVDVEAALSEPQAAEIATTARDFFRAGGVLSWDEWTSMSAGTRVLFRGARNEVEAERMVALAAAFLGGGKREKPMRDEDAVSAALDGAAT